MIGPDAVSTPWLSTDPNHPNDPNHLLLPDGSRFRGRGANIHDTRSCDSCTFTAPQVGEVLRRIDELVDGWGANFVRLVLESYPSAGDPPGRTHWQGVLTDPGYLSDLQTIVAHIGSKPGVYVLVSLWQDPTFTTAAVPATEPEGWPSAATLPVLDLLATTFAAEPHVLFGVCNEPTNNSTGVQDPSVWTAMNDAVEAIRTAETAAGAPQQHIVAVQGTRDWARVLDYYVTHPILAGGGTNIAYETHPYNPSGDFNTLFEVPSATLPVIIGEFGPSDDPAVFPPPRPIMTLADCDALMASARALDIPHLGWTFHMNCPPNMLVDNSGGGCGVGMALAPTTWGTHIQAGLAAPW